MQQPLYSHGKTEETRIDKSERLARLKKSVMALQKGKLSKEDFDATMAAAQDLVTQISKTCSGLRAARL
jgi:hypothetical protein